jgi:prophage regulatory protein
VKDTQTNPLKYGPGEGEPGRLLRLPAVLEMVGLGRSAWLDRVRSGTAPKPVKAGRCSLWVESECKAWVVDRIRSTRGGA